MKSALVTMLFLGAFSGAFFALSAILRRWTVPRAVGICLFAAIVVSFFVGLHLLDRAMGGAGLASMLSGDSSLFDRR